MHWYLIGGIATGFAVLAGRYVFRRQSQQQAADASGLTPVRDLTHISQALQRTALWRLSDGGFERRVVHGVISRSTEDIDVTAFDLETLRERRGEWAYLPTVPPFRIGGTVSVVVGEIDRQFPHLLLKHKGHGDALADDNAFERSISVAKAARDGLGLARAYAADLPATLAPDPLAVAALPQNWRAYGSSSEQLVDLLANGFAAALERVGRRDLVVELLEGLVVIYPAALDVVGADAFANLTSTALAVFDAILAASPRLSPRGIEPHGVA